MAGGAERVGGGEGADFGVALATGLAGAEFPELGVGELVGEDGVDSSLGLASGLEVEALPGDGEVEGSAVLEGLGVGESDMDGVGD